MIEYMHKTDPNPYPEWYTAKPDFNPRKADFDRVYFRVDGIIFRFWNEEFEKAVAWHTLKKPEHD